MSNLLPLNKCYSSNSGPRAFRNPTAIEFALESCLLVESWKSTISAFMRETLQFWLYINERLKTTWKTGPKWHLLVCKQPDNSSNRHELPILSQVVLIWVYKMPVNFTTDHSRSKCASSYLKLTLTHSQALLSPCQQPYVLQPPLPSDSFCNMNCCCRLKTEARGQCKMNGILQGKWDGAARLLLSWLIQ